MTFPQTEFILARYNHHGHSILARYECRVSQQQQSIHSINEQQQQQHPNDRFNFHINAISCTLDSNTLFVHVTTLLESCEEIACKSFFQEGQDFLRFHLSHPYIPSESLDLIIPKIMSQVQQLFDHTLASSDPNLDSEYECKVFPLELDIIVDPDRVEHVRVEERISKSNEAIHSMKEFIKIMSQNKHDCIICMEEFEVGDNDGIEATAMPCDHVFHHQCIMQWLKTSNTCPLCRYALPSANSLAKRKNVIV